MTTALIRLFLGTLIVLVQPAQFRLERQLTPGASGPNRIAPDVALLSGAAYSDLRDLRLYEAAGAEVPYLLIPPENPAPRWRPGKILAVAATKRTSGFEVDLGSAAPTDRLRLSGIPAPFLKRFQLEGSGDRSRWTLLVAEGTLFDLPDESLHLTEVGFDAGEYRYLRVTWDDRESGVVPEPKAAAGRLVEPRAAPTPLRATAEFRRLAAGPGRSRFQVRLPGPHLPLAAVELGVNETRLLRSAQVTEGFLQDGEVIPKTLGTSTLRRVVQGNLVASDTRIPIRAPEGREIEIIVEDNDNPSLSLTGVTLEFSPQPWIYFESPTAAPIAAKYGDSRLTPPRYDLEAIRQYIGRSDLHEAHWSDARNLQPMSAAGDVSLELPPGAPIDVQPFRYSRKVPDSPAGLTALVLDAPVLAHARPDLGDLRIADGENHQIPYLLERRQDVLAINLPPLVTEKSEGAKQSQYRLVIPFENLPATKLVLTTTERTFRRNITLRVKRPARDSRAAASWEDVASATWRHDDPETPTPPLRLDVHASLGTREAILVVDEGDNRPLPMAAPHLELPLYRLRFFYPANSKVTLLYGQEQLSAPRYDLELLAPRLIGLSSRELILDPENLSAPPVSNSTAIEARVFWAALVAAVLVVLGLLVRLLRSEPKAT